MVLGLSGVLAWVLRPRPGPTLPPKPVRSDKTHARTHLFFYEFDAFTARRRRSGLMLRINPARGEETGTGLRVDLELSDPV